MVSTQETVCYCLFSSLEVILILAQFAYVRIKLVNKQYKPIQTWVITFFFISYLIGLILTPKFSYLHCILTQTTLNETILYLVAAANIFRYTIPSGMMIINIIMSYNMFQNSKALKQNVLITTLALAGFCIVQFFAETYCIYGDSSQCPIFEEESIITSAGFYSLQITFRLIPYGAELVLILLLQKCLKVEYYEYEEGEQLLRDKQNELYVIQQKRLISLQILLIMCSFLVEMIYPNAIEPFLNVRDNNNLWKCWLLCFIQLVAVAIHGFVFMLKINIAKVVNEGK